jgi:hypothetical protein
MHGTENSKIPPRFFPQGKMMIFSPDNQSVIIVRTVLLKSGENLSGNQSNSNSK